MLFAKNRPLFAVLLSCVWINAFEFLRNELFLKNVWLAHYQSLGLVFPSAPVNGAVWGLWGLVFAGAIYAVSRQFSLLKGTFLCWSMGFVLMWLVIGNLNVLPMSVLPYAVPLSLLETGVAFWLCTRIAPLSANQSQA